MPKGFGCPLPLDSGDKNSVFSPELRAEEHLLEKAEIFAESKFESSQSVLTHKMNYETSFEYSKGEKAQPNAEEWSGSGMNEERGISGDGVYLQCGMTFSLQSIACCFVEEWERETKVPLIETLLVGKEHIKAYGPVRTRRLVEVSPGLWRGN